MASFLTGLALVINPQTGTSYTPVPTDAGLDRLITLSNTGGITVTIPTNASVPYPVGTVLNFAAIGAGQVTTALASGVTALGGALKSARQGAMWSAVKVDTNTWVINGDLVA